MKKKRQRKMERNPHKDALNDNKLYFISKTLFELVILYNFAVGFVLRQVR